MRKFELFTFAKFSKRPEDQFNVECLAIAKCYLQNYYQFVVDN